MSIVQMTLLASMLLVTIVILGLPLVWIFGRVRPPRSRRPASAPSVAVFHAVGPPYVPMQMSDSGMRWPSEIPRRSTAMTMLPWPSETWSDNPFPASNGEGAARAIASLARAEAAVTRDAVRTTATPAPAPVVKPSKAKKATKPQRSEPLRKAASPPVVRPTAPRAEVPLVQIDDDERPEVPTTAVILAIAEQDGLAAAVDNVRTMTGWSFQKAAQHVALALRGHT